MNNDFRKSNMGRGGALNDEKDDPDLDKTSEDEVSKRAEPGR